MGWEFIAALAKLIVFLILVLLLAYLVIRYGLPLMGQGGMRGSHLRIVDRLVLNAKSSIIVIEVAGKYFLLAINDGNTSLIKELDDYPQVEIQEGVNSGITEMVQKTKERFADIKHGKRD